MRKKKPDLEKLAQEAQDALSFLEEQGFVMEVQSVRDYLIAQGEHFRTTQKINRDIVRDLVDQHHRHQREIHGVPV